MRPRMCARTSATTTLLCGSFVLALVLGGCPVTDDPQADGLSNFFLFSRGTQGQDGQDGADGSDGATGVAGETGNAGTDGTSGADGSDGTSGQSGRDGVDGVDGQDGSDGAVGPQGPAGPAGEQGPPGPVGEEGPAGPVGEEGPAGDPGLPGEPGAIGPEGPEGERGPRGFSCWDLNMNGEADYPEEDVNGDDVIDILDCQSLPGPACWDTNGNGEPDYPEEDVNNDGFVDVYDCRGPAGPEGPMGPAGPEGPEGVAGPMGPAGPEGPIGPEGPMGPEGLMGPEGPMGPAGTSCWDLNANGVADFPDEDQNGDGFVDVYDCQGDAVAVDAWELGGNAVATAQVLGTLTEAAIDVVVNGVRGLRIEPTMATANLIGGYAGNVVGPDVVGATIAGGGAADDGTGADGANVVNADYGFIGGGLGNTVEGLSGVVPGGERNTAGGAYSIAGGYRAKAMHPGAFVWSDSVATDDLVSQRDDEFRVRARGGITLQPGANSYFEVRFNAGRFVDTSTNAYLSVGGAWVNSSSVENKTNLVTVSEQDVLSQVVSLPIYTWSYISEGEEIVHMGPMSQDFHAIFGLGYDDESLATVDLDGVALAAIKGLHEQMQAQQSVIAAQQSQIAALQGQVSDLEARLSALEELVERAAGPKGGEKK